MKATPQDQPPRLSERYVLYDEIASGGMGTVHLGRLVGPVGFSRIVAIKRLHPAHAKEPDFVAMFLDEARVAARVRHPNVVSTIDVVELDSEVLLVMDYVEGESLSRLLRSAQSRGERVPLNVASAIIVNLLTGLDAAHRAKGELGAPLGIVHRDVSPQNVLVGVDGVARVVDFGIAKANGRLQTTQDGQIKGKAAYMAPEQLRGKDVDARADVYGAAVVLWEIVAGTRLFLGSTPEETVVQILERDIALLSASRSDVPPALDDVVLRGLAREREERFPSAREMAIAVERAVSPATQREVGEWVSEHLSNAQRERAERVARIEAETDSGERLLPVTDTTAEATSISQISVATKRADDPKTRRRAPIAALLGLALLTLVSIVVWRVSRAPLEPPQPASVTLPVATPEVRPEPPASVSVPRAIESSAPGPSAKRLVRPRVNKAPAKPATARNCNPPWTLDANGFRVPKAECF
jgi:eukaryotic-like serine/threonine-protein kinase